MNNFVFYERTELAGGSYTGFCDYGATGTLNTSVLPYNQGTFIGLAGYLYQETDDSDYYDDAMLALDYAQENFCNSQGVYTKTGRYNGIFFRWVGRFIYDCGLGQTYTDWRGLRSICLEQQRQGHEPDGQGFYNAFRRGDLPCAFFCSPGVVLMQIYGESLIPAQRSVRFH